VSAIDCSDARDTCCNRCNSCACRRVVLVPALLALNRRRVSSGIASSTYGYGPGYGYSGGGYASVYYGDMPRPTMAGAHSTMATETAIGGCIQPTLTMSGSTTMRVGAEAGVTTGKPLRENL